MHIQSLGLEDPLEKEMATHSSGLFMGNPIDRGAWQSTVHGTAELDMIERLSTHIPVSSKNFPCIILPSRCLLIPLTFDLNSLH